MALSRHEPPTRDHDHMSPRERAEGWRAEEWDAVPDVPHVGVFQALRRHWIIALLPVLAFVALGATYGLTRSPVYTASTTLSVAQTDLNSPGALAGFAAASQALASAYSRAVDTEALTAPVARSLRLHPAAVDRQTTASPVPQSPVVNVYASAYSQEEAIALANAMSRRLVAFVDRMGKSDARGRALLSEYRRAVRAQEDALARQRRAQRAYDQAPTRQSQGSLARARAETSARQLRSESLSSRYQHSQEALAAGSVLELLSPSRQATSDRRSRFQLAVFVGLAAGLIVGAALASLRFQAVARRSALALRGRR
jgi:hypothetical protein